MMKLALFLASAAFVAMFAATALNPSTAGPGDPMWSAFCWMIAGGCTVGTAWAVGTEPINHMFAVFGLATFTLWLVLMCAGTTGAAYRGYIDKCAEAERPCQKCAACPDNSALVCLPTARP